MATLSLDTNQYERSAPQGGPLPPGVYTGTVVRVQQKETNDKQGVYEEVEFDISHPVQFSNRKFWDRFNVINKSVKAQQIGREALADLAKASGITGVINDDQELMGKTVQLRLIVKPSDNPQYPDPKNECRKYYPVGVDADAEDKRVKGAAAPQQIAAGVAASGGIRQNWGNAGTPAAAAPQTAAQVAPAAAGAAPWKK